MLDVKELCTKLAKYHWSPKLPTSYVVPGGAGLGTIAPNCYGTFNLVWANQRLLTQEDHRQAIMLFIEQRLRSEQMIRGAPLADWLTLLTAKEFSYWYAANGSKVHAASRVVIERALLNVSGKVV